MELSCISHPFENLHAEKEFYEALYKSYRNRAQQGGAFLNYEDRPILKLSEECKRLGEEVITLEACSRVLNSFVSNKVPGNDGLPVASNKLFGTRLGNF